MPQGQTLAQRVKAKYPGVYDDIADADLETKVKAKYPGVYDDMPLTTASADPTQGRSAASRAAGGFINAAGLNPATWLELGSNLVQHPIDTTVNVAKGIVAPLGRLGNVPNAYRQGGVTGALNEAAASIPILGPAAEHATERINSGDVAGGVGEGLGTVAGLVAPSLLSKARGLSIPVKSGLTNPNAAEAAAVAYGQRAGIPVDAATATGSRVVRGVQTIADRSLGGAMIAEPARAAQEGALARVSGGLANKTGRSARTAEQAGQGVTDAVKSRAATLQGEANTAYDTLRTLEEQRAKTVEVAPATTRASTVLDASGKPVQVPVPARTARMLAVDTRATRGALKPIYEGLKREAELVPLMGDKARALTSLDRLMTAPDMAPLSVVDAALSDLKGLARVDETFRRTAGQGATAVAVQNLNAAVVKAAANAGPDVHKALMEGRAATIKKYKAITVLDKLRDEPVGVFRQMTANQDAAVQLLRDIQREAPAELPNVGRAYLDGLFEKATAEGGFSRTNALQAEWQKLGPQTKALLFKPDHVKDLNDFFLLSKRLADNPNPSGSAHLGLLGAQGAYTVLNPMTGIPMQVSLMALSKLLHSPLGVKALTRGLRVPVNAKVAQVSAYGALVQAAERQGVSFVPAMAGEPAGAQQ